MSYSAEETIDKATAMSLLKNSKYGDIDMALITRLAEQCTEFDIDRERQRIGMHNSDSGLYCILPLCIADNPDYMQEQWCRDNTKLTATQASDLIRAFVDSTRASQLVIHMSKGNYGYGLINMIRFARESQRGAKRRAKVKPKTKQRMEIIDDEVERFIRGLGLDEG